MNKPQEETDITALKIHYDDIVGEINIIRGFVNFENSYGRNNMCFCDSGKKFKKCHMLEHEEKEHKIQELTVELEDIRQDIMKIKKEDAKKY